jgi:hypothetical protein
MQEIVDDGGAREAELLEVLSNYAEPRAVSFRFVVAFVLLGLVGCASLAWLVAGAPRREPLRFEPPPASGFQRGVGAFHAADWDEALRSMREAQAAMDEPLPRLEDFIERLELTLRDEERLSRAEQALAGNEPERALAVAALIAPNSLLFAQAESLQRKARAQLQASTPSLQVEPDPLPAELAEQAESSRRRGRRAAEPVRAAKPTRAPERAATRPRAASRARGGGGTRDQPDAW